MERFLPHRVCRLRGLRGQVNQAKQAARKPPGSRYIDLGLLGNPDLVCPTAPPMSSRRLKETLAKLGKPRVPDRYSASSGNYRLRKAQKRPLRAAFRRSKNSARFFLLFIRDPDRWATAGLSKEALCHCGPGDQPGPGGRLRFSVPKSKAIRFIAFGLLDGRAGRVFVLRYPRSRTPHFFEGGRRRRHSSFDPKAARDRVCYPSQSTGNCREASNSITRGFLFLGGPFPRRQQKPPRIFLLSDRAYAEVYFDTTNPAAPVPVLQGFRCLGRHRRITSMSSKKNVFDGRLGADGSWPSATETDHRPGNWRG